MPQTPGSPEKNLWTAFAVTGILALVIVFADAHDFVNVGMADMAAVAGALNTSTTAGTTSTGSAAAVLSSAAFKPKIISTPVLPTASSLPKGIPSTISGQYVIGIAKTSPLITASSSIAAVGGKVLYVFQYSHDIVAQLTASQVIAVRHVAGVQYVTPNYSVSTTQGVVTQVGTTITSTSATSPVVQAGNPTVAIVDDFSTPTSHGYAVLQAYQDACAASSCGIMNPTLISAVDSSGDMTDASVDNATDYALTNGAKDVNVSSTADCIAGDCNLAGQESTDDANTWSLANATGAVITYSAGNNAAYTSEGYFAGNPYIQNGTVVFVGALDPTTGLLAAYSTPSAQVFANGTVTFNGQQDAGTSFAAPTYMADLIATSAANPTYTQQQDEDATDQSPGLLTNADFSTSYTTDGSMTVTYNNFISSDDGAAVSINTTYSFIGSSANYTASTNITTYSSDDSVASNQNVVYQVTTADTGYNYVYSDDTDMNEGGTLVSDTTETANDDVGATGATGVTGASGASDDDSAATAVTDDDTNDYSADDSDDTAEIDDDGGDTVTIIPTETTDSVGGGSDSGSSDADSGYTSSLLSGALFTGLPGITSVIKYNPQTGTYTLTISTPEGVISTTTKE